MTSTFDKLAAIAETRKLTPDERASLTGDELNELGRRAVLRSEHEQRSRMRRDAVWGTAHPSPEDQARIEESWALTQPASEAVREAIIAVDAANLHYQRERAEALSRPSGGLSVDPDSPAVIRRLAPARQLVKRAEEDLAAATAARETLFEQARRIERTVLEGVQRRFVDAVNKANQAAEKEAQAARRNVPPDSRPALHAAALNRLRESLGMRAA